MSLTKPSGHWRHPSSESRGASLPCQEGVPRAALRTEPGHRALRGENLLSAGKLCSPSGLAHSPFFLGLFFQSRRLLLRYILRGEKSHCFPFRPGCCAKHGLAEAYKTSIDFPDETLSFIKSHPLMDAAVPPIADEPWFTKTRIR